MIPGPRQIIIFKENTGTVTDGMSDTPIPDWTELYIKTGVFATVRGDEQIIAGQPTVIATHKIYVDYDAETALVTEKNQATIGGKDYEILWIDNPGLINEALILKLRLVG